MSNVHPWSMVIIGFASLKGINIYYETCLVLVFVLDLNEAKEVGHQPLHLLLRDCPIAVHVKHSEYLGKHILGSSV